MPFAAGGDPGHADRGRSNEPGLPARIERTSRALRMRFVLEEPVHRRARARDVRAKGAERDELAPLAGKTRDRSQGALRGRSRRVCPRAPRERRRGGPRTRQRLRARRTRRRSQPWTPSPRRTEARARPRNRVGARTGLSSEPSFVASLRPLLEEERDVRAELGSDRAQPTRGERRADQLVGEPQRRRGIRATSTEACSDGNPLLDPDRPAALAGDVGELGQRRAARSCPRILRPRSRTRTSARPRPCRAGRPHGARSRPRACRRDEAGRRRARG